MTQRNVTGRKLRLTRPFFKPLWIGRAGFGWVWRGVEHQVYRNLDGSMPKRINHYTMPFTEEAWLNWDDQKQRRIK